MRDGKRRQEGRETWILVSRLLTTKTHTEATEDRRSELFEVNSVQSLLLLNAFRAKQWK